MESRATLILLLATGLAGWGCANRTNQQVAPGPDAPDWLLSIHIGKDDKRSIVERVGEPAGIYESGTILIYRLDEDYRPVDSLGSTRFNLVLQFKEDGILRRKRLIQVR